MKNTTAEEFALAAEIRGQVYECWNVPEEASERNDMVVMVHITYNKRGNPALVDIPKRSSDRYKSDPIFRKVADSAMLAVKQCAPLKYMTIESYHTWRYVDIIFNAQATPQSNN